MAKCLIFTHVPEAAAEELKSTLEVDRVRELLNEYLGDVPTELGLEALRICRQHLWSSAQVSAFLAILLHVITFDAQTSVDTMEKSFAYLKSLVVLHSCERPPWTSGLFTPEEAHDISTFFMENYYRNYRLFKQLCCKSREKLDLSIVPSGDGIQEPEAKQSENDYFLTLEEARFIRSRTEAETRKTDEQEANISEVDPLAES